MTQFFGITIYYPSKSLKQKITNKKNNKNRVPYGKIIWKNATEAQITFLD